MSICMYANLVQIVKLIRVCVCVCVCVCACLAGTVMYSGAHKSDRKNKDALFGVELDDDKIDDAAISGANGVVGRLDHKVHVSACIHT